jgi:hypothetical protein
MDDTTIPVDVGLDAIGDKQLQPVPRLVNLILYQAVSNAAVKIDFSLTQSPGGFRISYLSKGTTHDIASPAKELYEPCILVLCNYASVPYYKKGLVRGRLETTNPDWLLESQDLKQHVTLLKI